MTKSPRAGLKALTLAIALAAVSCSAAIATEPANPVDMDGLAWMAGTWKGDTWQAHYSTPEGGVILGVSKETIPGRPLFWEFEKIEERDGAIRLTPYLMGKEAVSFPLVSLDVSEGGGGRAVFENPEHDFPRRIVFHRPDAMGLVIEISGERGGKPATQRMDLVRVREH